tara:strand:+ start:701 stop:982 length:282 start_codon:yes stop_codon:yes gene_type:complete
MNQYIYSYSESLVLSLCEEIEYIRSRSKNIKNSLKTCHNKILSKRLFLELENLNKKRLKILNISESMFNKNSKDLSFEFLLEITRRSNLFQQI